MSFARGLLAVSKRPVLVVLRPLGLGDFLTGVPAYRALARAFPEHRRLLAVPSELAPLVPLTGAFHGIVPAAPLDDLALDGPVDVAVNLHGCGPQSHRVLLRLAPSRLLAFAHPDIPESHDGPAWGTREHEVQRWCRMLSEYGIDADPSELDLAPPPLPDRLHGYTLIHPGAASPARRWPAERWAAIARRERAGRRRVVITGGPHEQALAMHVARRADLPLTDVHAGDLGLLELASLVRGAGMILCGDTGVAHLATALRRPSVLLFGPTAPGLWGPPPDRGWHHVLWAGWSGDPHADQVHPGLLEIAVEDVLSEMIALRSSVLELALHAEFANAVARASGEPVTPAQELRRELWA
jgi:ADP-heptose:LPS heptosyltransferase